MAFARSYGADEVGEDYQQVADWMSEVEKEIE